MASEPEVLSDGPGAMSDLGEQDIFEEGFHFDNDIENEKPHKK